MASNFKTNYDNGTRFSVIMEVDKKDYTTWKERVIQRLLENVQVDGFRKGKAPMHIALAKVGSDRIQETVFNETIDRYAFEAISEARKVLETDDRKILEYFLDTDPSFVGELDGGFKFKIVFNILPVIDLSGLTSLKKPKVSKKDLPQRLTLEEFLENRKAFFVQTANSFHVEKNPDFQKYESFAELMEKDEEFVGAYPTEDKFVETFTSVYNNETKQIEEDAMRHLIIIEAVKAIPEFELSQDRLSSEIERIVKSIEDISTSNNQTLTQVVLNSGIIGVEDKDKKFESISDVRDAVEIYVRNEMKWTYIQRAIYEHKVDPKLSQEEIQQVGKTMAKDPKQYDVQGGLSEEQYESIAFDRMVRNRAANWLFDTVFSNSLESQAVKSTYKVTDVQVKEVSAETEPKKKVIRKKKTDEETK